MTRRTLSVSIALAAVVTLTLTGCSGGDSSDGAASGESDAYKLIQDGTLTVCSDVPYPPFEVEDSSTETGYSGFDIDLLAAVAKKLDLTLAVQDVGFDALQSGTTLAAGTCDLGASAITITDKRKANIDFSAPYYDSLQSLLVRADSGIKSIEDLDDKTVGVQTGTTGETYTRDNVSADVEVVSYASDGELWPALQAGQIDAILQDLPVNIMHEQSDSTYTVVEQYDTDEQYGFAFEKGERDELIEAFNGALEELREDGEYQKIYDSYFTAE